MSESASQNDLLHDDNVIDDNNLDVPYVVLDAPYGGKVYLIGTAHFSVKSQNEVVDLIRQVQPNRVVLELCSSRINILKYDEATLLKASKEMNTNTIIQLMKEVV